MAENQTVPTEQSVKSFLDKVEDEQKRADSWALVKLMEEASGEKAKMWGPAIIGFGQFHYKYESGREGDSPLIGFSPRKQNLAMYYLTGSPEFETLATKLGKWKMGKGCLYLNKLQDADVGTLKKIIERAMVFQRQSHAG